MAKAVVVVSEISGDVVKDNEHVSIVVLDHELLRRPVRIDAKESEIKSLEGAGSDFTIIELHRPNQAAERLVIEQTKFDALFKGDVGEVLDNAEPVEEEQPKRRGRPAGSGAGTTAAKPKRDPAQLAAIRTWWRAQGNEISDRGRIPQNVEDAYHASGAK